MIQVTLSFINADAAIRGLREIPQNLLVGEGVVPAPIVEEKPVTEKVTAKKDVPTEKTNTLAKQEAASTPPTAEKAAAPEQKAASSDAKPESIEYPVLQKAVFALAAKSREVAMATVASFGVKTFKELPADKWADALAAVNAKLAEV